MHVYDIVLIGNILYNALVSQSKGFPSAQSHSLVGVPLASHLPKLIPCLSATIVIVIITIAIIVTKWSLQGPWEEISVCWIHYNHETTREHGARGRETKERKKTNKRTPPS